MARTNQTRAIFINSTIEVARNYEFDGLDLDWEFPANDQEMFDFALLLEEWQQALDDDARTSAKPRLLLTSAVYYSSRFTTYGDPRSYPAQAINSFLDWINPMCYDYHGAWENFTGPNSALFATSNLSTSHGIGSWIEAGVPPEKLIMGLPLYGRTWKLKDPNINGIGAEAVGPGPGNGTLSYSQILEFNSENKGTVHFDGESVSYYSVAGDAWIAYDDTMSVDRKIQFARSQGLGGYFFWALGQDKDWTITKLVTTTSQAIAALKMLRENKNKFDLVISDVHMPDMDGFKLLELVGLEMDLPVIMLSANSDPKLVMKGISHGACDYLLKPVRMEELKNIWQHVIRRRKFNNKDRNHFDNQDKLHHGSSEATADQKLNKKRKDQNEDEDEDRDDNEHENEDPTTQKKPRVVWSVELHRKFVAAVNQLGIDKAVPKKILDLMNVEKLTRENVASHLQKYRLYLKRISTVANQQANMVAALGSTDSSYLQMGSVNGLGFPNLAGTGQFHNAAFRSLPPSGMLGHLTNCQSQFQSIVHTGNDGNVLQGMLMSLEVDQIQPNKGVTYIRELPTDVNNTTTFSVSNGFQDAKIMASSSNSAFLGVSNKPLMLEGSVQEVQDGRQFGKQSSLTVASLDSGFSSNFLDHGRCNDSWSSAVQSTGDQSNSFGLNDCFKQATLLPSNIRDSMSTMALQSGNNPSQVSSISTVPIHLQDSKADLQCQIASIRSNTRQIINNAPQGWDDQSQRRDATYHSNAECSSINSVILIMALGVLWARVWTQIMQFSIEPRASIQQGNQILWIHF
ncbi:hypothetical protein GH714_008693 [Hevea brasiliensis]|uniref:Two-component response regulator n=1 Tax=Hevea brasiliensis TaxID=3981 RepID=A0A6A6MKJ5_HEVBR|nr:hypothetical protein GH714_008693 [Hevea brasiliensis]